MGLSDETVLQDVLQQASAPATSRLILLAFWPPRESPSLSAIASILRL